MGWRWARGRGRQGPLRLEGGQQAHIHTGWLWPVSDPVIPPASRPGCELLFANILWTLFDSLKRGLNVRPHHGRQEEKRLGTIPATVSSIIAPAASQTLQAPWFQGRCSRQPPGRTASSCQGGRKSCFGCARASGSRPDRAAGRPGPGGHGAKGRAVTERRALLGAVPWPDRRRHTFLCGRSRELRGTPGSILRGLPSLGAGLHPRGRAWNGAHRQAAVPSLPSAHLVYQHCAAQESLWMVSVRCL